MQPLFWQENVSVLIATTRRRIKQVLWRRLRVFELTPPQFAVIRILTHEKDPSLALVADHLGIDAPTASRVVDHLRKLKLIVTVTDPTDRRRFRIRLTPAGRRKAAAMARVIDDLDVDLERGLTEKARKDLRASLQTIVSNMDRLEHELTTREASKRRTSRRSQELQ